LIVGRSRDILYPDDVQTRRGIQSPDCVAGHVRLELRNVVAKYPFERSHGFPENQQNSGTEIIRV